MSHRIRTFIALPILALFLHFVFSCSKNPTSIIQTERPYAEVGRFVYSAAGDSIFLPIIDSLILVKPNPEYPDFDGTSFAAVMPCLAYEITYADSDYSSPGVPYGYNLFRIADGYELEYVAGELWQSSEVDLVNPVFMGIAPYFIYMTDTFIARFHDGVSRTQIDSLNAVFNAGIVEIGPDILTRYLLNITQDTKMDCLLTCQKYYESGLCKWAEPNFMTRGILLRDQK